MQFDAWTLLVYKLTMEVNFHVHRIHINTMPT